MKESAMIECISEEGIIIREILDNKDNYTKEIVNHFKKHKVKRIYISGHGSPYNVGHVLKFAIEDLLNIEVSVDYSSLFNNYLEFNVNGVYKPDEMLLICPAQSGRTKGPVLAAQKARKAGIPVICTTLLQDGILAKTCDIIIKKKSGVEESFPETKGHIASLTILLVAVIQCAFELDKIDEKEYQKYIENFYLLSDNIEKIIHFTETWYEINKKELIIAKDLTFVGYGENYPTAVEGSLKILETTLKACMSYECEEYMHGQNQPVDQNSYIFMIANRGKEFNRIHQLADWCRLKGAHVVLITDEEDELKSKDDILVPSMEYGHLSTISYLIPFQVLGYYIARDMGLSSIIANHDDAGKELGVRYED
ncbi:MAG: SIS domain-containing protein [Erysipelotrichaceae bacterium]